MKLVAIYGPPAAGKLTVAQELAAITGYKLFHNHLTMNAVLPLFEFGSDELIRVLCRIRLEIIGEAARCGISVIFTLAPFRRKELARPTVVDRFAADLAKVVGDAGGEVVRVQLCPPPEVLLERVTNESRALHGKLNDAERMRTVIEEREMYDLLDPSDMVIDNSETSPCDVAVMIRDHYELPNVG